MDDMDLSECVQQLQKSIECSICLDSFNNPVETRCGHTFCGKCLETALSKKYIVPCPLCKSIIKKRGIKNAAYLSSVVTAVQNILNACKPVLSLQVNGFLPQSTSFKLRNNFPKHSSIQIEKTLKQSAKSDTPDMLDLLDNVASDLSVVASKRYSPKQKVKFHNNSSMVLSSSNKSNKIVNKPQTEKHLIEKTNRKHCKYKITPRKSNKNVKNFNKENKKDTNPKKVLNKSLLSIDEEVNNSKSRNSNILMDMEEFDQDFQRNFRRSSRRSLKTVKHFEVSDQPSCQKSTKDVNKKENSSILNSFSRTVSNDENTPNLHQDQQVMNKVENWLESVHPSAHSQIGSENSESMQLTKDDLQNCEDDDENLLSASQQDVTFALPRFEKKQISSAVLKDLKEKEDETNAKIFGQKCQQQYHPKNIVKDIKSYHKTNGNKPTKKHFPEKPKRQRKENAKSNFDKNIFDINGLSQGVSPFSSPAKSNCEVENSENNQSCEENGNENSIETCVNSEGEFKLQKCTSSNHNNHSNNPYVVVNSNFNKVIDESIKSCSRTMPTSIEVRSAKSSPKTLSNFPELHESKEAVIHKNFGIDKVSENKAEDSPSLQQLRPDKSLIEDHVGFNQIHDCSTPGSRSTISTIDNNFHVKTVIASIHKQPENNKTSSSSCFFKTPTIRKSLSSSFVSNSNQASCVVQLEDMPIICVGETQDDYGKPSKYYVETPTHSIGSVLYDNISHAETILPEQPESLTKNALQNEQHSKADLNAISIIKTGSDKCTEDDVNKFLKKHLHHLKSGEEKNLDEQQILGVLKDNHRITDLNKTRSPKNDIFLKSTKTQEDTNIYKVSKISHTTVDDLPDDHTNNINFQKISANACRSQMSKTNCQNNTNFGPMHASKKLTSTWPLSIHHKGTFKCSSLTTELSSNLHNSSSNEKHGRKNPDSTCLPDQSTNFDVISSSPLLFIQSQTEAHCTNSGKMHQECEDKCHKIDKAMQCDESDFQLKSSPVKLVCNSNKSVDKQEITVLIGKLKQLSQNLKNKEILKKIEELHKLVDTHADILVSSSSQVSTVKRSTARRKRVFSSSDENDINNSSMEIPLQKSPKNADDLDDVAIQSSLPELVKKPLAKRPSYPTRTYVFQHTSDDVDLPELTQTDVSRNCLNVNSSPDQIKNSSLLSNSSNSSESDLEIASTVRSKRRKRVISSDDENCPVNCKKEPHANISSTSIFKSQLRYESQNNGESFTMFEEENCIRETDENKIVMDQMTRFELNKHESVETHMSGQCQEEHLVSDGLIKTSSFNQSISPNKPAVNQSPPFTLSQVPPPTPPPVHPPNSSTPGLNEVLKSLSELTKSRNNLDDSFDNDLIEMESKEKNNQNGAEQINNFENPVSAAISKEAIKYDQNQLKDKPNCNPVTSAPTTLNDLSLSDISNSPGKRNLGLMVSGLGGKAIGLVRLFTKKWGGEFFESFVPGKITHAVVRTQNMRCDRTLKFLQAVASKAWIVSISWITHSLKEKKLLPEDKYEIIGDNLEISEELSYSPRRSRLSPDTFKLLSGFAIHCIPPFALFTEAQFVELLQLCGASIVSKPEDFIKCPCDFKRIITIDPDAHSNQLPSYAGLVDKYDAEAVSCTWALDCIGTFHLQSTSNFPIDDLDSEMFSCD